MSDHSFIPKSNSKIVPPFIPKPKETLEAENARLKAEVEELTHDANEADQQYEHAISRVRRLEAEVERLRKAGDFMQKAMLECGPNEMADYFHHDDWWASYNGWTIAKSHQP